MGQTQLFLDTLILRRHELKMSQSALAKLAGVSRNYISQIERGQIDGVSFKVFGRVCGALKLTFRMLAVKYEDYRPTPVPKQVDAPEFPYCKCDVFKPNHLRIEPTCAFCDKPLGAD
jgi:transcriptional regulator with XRE-family HTH domain